MTMKRFFRTMLATATLLCAAACARHTIIPDDELALIFHDAFLTNAYIGSQNVRIDSLNIYEPIFARYGYTTEDVQYTIGNFSKRKSARLGDVVELAIDLLEEEGKRYNREVAILDTIDNVAQRTFTRTVLSDSLIRVRSLRDTARLSFVVDVEPGEYRLTMRYLVDSMDRNDRVLRSQMWIERNDSTRAYPYSLTLRRRRVENFTRTFRIDTTHRRLHLHLLTFTDPSPKRPSVTVYDLQLTHTPETRTAVDSLYIKQLNLRIFADEFFRAALPKDSL